MFPALQPWNNDWDNLQSVFDLNKQLFTRRYGFQHLVQRGNALTDESITLPSSDVQLPQLEERLILHSPIAASDPFRRFVVIDNYLPILRQINVNLDRVRELQPYFRRSHAVILKDGTKLKLSRARRQKLEVLLESGKL